MRVTIPSSLFEVSDDIAKCIENQGLTNEVVLKKYKFQIKLKKYEGFFEKVVKKIIKTVEEILKSDEAEDGKVIIMVGGFSESDFLQRKFKDSFENCKLVIP